MKSDGYNYTQLATIAFTYNVPPLNLALLHFQTQISLMDIYFRYRDILL